MYKKVNLPLLEKFKHHIQSQGEKRVPLLIDQLLKEELWTISWFSPLSHHFIT